MGWLREVDPGGMIMTGMQLDLAPRFLHFWFSHPPLEPISYNGISLLDGAGKPIQLGGHGSMSIGDCSANKRNGNLAWLTPTVSPGEGTNLPSKVTIRLTYAAGPLEHVQEVALTPNSQVAMALEGGSAVSGVGQDAEGKAFIAIGVDVASMLNRRFDVVAVAKDGHEISSNGGRRSGTVGASVAVANFPFNLPLAEVAKFRIGTRLILTNEWRDVVLPGN